MDKHSHRSLFIHINLDTGMTTHTCVCWLPDIFHHDAQLQIKTAPGTDEVKTW